MSATKKRNGPMPLSAAERVERFWSKVDRADKCWVWMGAHNGEGYGSFWDGVHQVLAHRHAYELSVGPVPTGKQLDHLCRNRRCCNPAHLEPVTRRENILRGDGPSAHAARATHCPKGHPYAGGNLYLSPKGNRFCRECHRADMRNRRRMACHR